MYEGYALRKELADEKQKELRLARIEQLESQVFERAAAVVEAVISFHEVVPGQTEPPAAWIAEYGEEGARQRLQVALTGWLPASVAPNATKIALQYMAGYTRAKAHRMGKLTQNNVNVKISLPAPTSREHPGPVCYEVRDIEE
jgi:hypothetical protein